MSEWRVEVHASAQLSIAQCGGALVVRYYGKGAVLGVVDSLSVSYKATHAEDHWSDIFATESEAIEALVQHDRELYAERRQTVDELRQQHSTYDKRREYIRQHSPGIFVAMCDKSSSVDLQSMKTLMNNACALAAHAYDDTH